ncbi:hypothetical protein INS49_010350 [Diaporthe citri]|uniref:uncharacterized protein n=1 Tax=Diaporthe citri TaxID=83186 RepID=UPI001C7E802C|nr:uncharacterized protein INS49_010350 [Diaporthe citri]KAG6362121.1 hypothetical protein INS49_010350 [Diaporthe citri]
MAWNLSSAWGLEQETISQRMGCTETGRWSITKLWIIAAVFPDGPGRIPGRIPSHAPRQVLS